MPEVAKRTHVPGTPKSALYTRWVNHVGDVVLKSESFPSDIERTLKK